MLRLLVGGGSAVLNASARFARFRAAKSGPISTWTWRVCGLMPVYGRNRCPGGRLENQASRRQSTPWTPRDSALSERKFARLSPSSYVRTAKSMARASSCISRVGMDGSWLFDGARTCGGPYVAGKSALMRGPKARMPCRGASWIGRPSSMREPCASRTVTASTAAITSGGGFHGSLGSGSALRTTARSYPAQGRFCNAPYPDSSRRS